VVGGPELAVIANTGDDVEVYGVHVSPDPDLVTYWLADAIDERGYGLRGDTWQVMSAFEAAGHPAWFRLGDRDLAMCLLRTELLRTGARLTDAHRAVVEAMGVEARVLPMSDAPVRTRIRTGGRRLPFQEFMIVEGAARPVEGVEFDGADRARPTPEVLEAIGDGEVTVIGPSNPVASIGPILALPGLRESLSGAGGPVVAVSPFVRGHAVKGPTELFCEHAGIERSAAGVARAYEGLIHGIVADEHVEGIPCLRTETLMDSAPDRCRVAETILDFADTLPR
jgi:LPPG:FO 2-phospho-L-lactate transferase